MSVRDRKCVLLKVGGPSELAQWPGTWSYWTHLDDLKIDEWVVVESPTDLERRRVPASGVPIVAQVVEINPSRQSCARAKKWIVDRIDWDKYRALQALAPPESEEME